MTEENKEIKGLVAKIAEITKQVKRIPKNGWNDFHKYWYATESDIKQVIREAMAFRGLILISDIVSYENLEIVTQKGKTERLTMIRVKYTIEDSETKETLEFHGVGTGQDAGDKGIYKAQTGALKYALTSLFLIPTGDDPEIEGKKLQPAKKAEKKQIQELKKIIGIVAKLDSKTEEEMTAYMLNRKGIETFIEDINEDEYGTLARYANELKNHFEKVNQK